MPTVEKQERASSRGAGFDDRLDDIELCLSRVETKLDAMIASLKVFKLNFQQSTLLASRK